MYNCYIVYIANRPRGIFHKESDARQYINLLCVSFGAYYSAHSRIEGKYIPDLPF